MDSIKPNPEEARDDTNPEDEEDEEEDTNPEEEQPDPIERCDQNKQVLIDARGMFVHHRIKTQVKIPMSEEDREFYDWITSSKNYYLTIESYERTRKTDTSDEVAEQLYKAMCKAYDDYDASRKVAIRHRDKMMSKTGSFTWWAGPL